MCGFITVFDKNKKGKSIEMSLIEEMNNVAKHRGPDDSGYFTDNGIMMGFRRLSIIDVENGEQPLTYKDRYVILFNGEIYNYVEQKKVKRRI